MFCCDSDSRLSEGTVGDGGCEEPLCSIEVQDGVQELKTQLLRRAVDFKPWFRPCRMPHHQAKGFGGQAFPGVGWEPEKWGAVVVFDSFQHNHFCHLPSLKGGCKLGKNWKVYFLPMCIFKRVSQCDVSSSMGTLKMTT